MTYVKTKWFQLRDIFLKRFFQNTQKLNEGKLKLNREGLYQVTMILRLSTFRLQYLEKKDIPRSWNSKYLWAYHTLSFDVLALSLHFLKYFILVEINIVLNFCYLIKFRSSFVSLLCMHILYTFIQKQLSITLSNSSTI